MHNGVTSHLWLKSALHASSHPCMCTCVLRLGCFLLACLVLYFVPLFSFQPFLMFTSEFNERSRSNPLCDFRLGTVVTSDYETPLTQNETHFNSLEVSSCPFLFLGEETEVYFSRHPSCTCFIKSFLDHALVTAPDVEHNKYENQKALGRKEGQAKAVRILPVWRTRESLQAQEMEYDFAATNTFISRRPSFSSRWCLDCWEERDKAFGNETRELFCAKDRQGVDEWSSGCDLLMLLQVYCKQVSSELNAVKELGNLHRVTFWVQCPQKGPKFCVTSSARWKVSDCMDGPV